MQKYWNGKICGIPKMLLLLAGGAWRNLTRRTFLLLHQANLATVGKRCRIGLQITFQYPGRIFLGNEISIADNVIFSSNNAEGYCRIGDNVNIDRNCRLDFSGGIQIGIGCTLSESVVIETHSHGYDPHSSPQAMPLVIEDGAWIGMRSLILPQVGRIGKGALIAAGSVVTHPVPDHAIVGGNPARTIKVKKA